MGKLKKRLIAMFACLSLGMSVAAFSACDLDLGDLLNGLGNNFGVNDQYSQPNEDEGIVFQGYKIANGSIYNYDEEGVMRTACYYDGYYFGEDGKLEGTNVFITIENNTYYVVNNVIVYNYQVIEGNVYYFGEDGKMATDREQDGYYFGTEGKLEGTNVFITIENNTYYVVNNVIVYNYQIIEGNVYYFGEDGKMATDREQDGYYFGVDGKLEAVNVFITIENNTYYVVNNVIVYNYQIIEGNVYYFGEDGKMVTDREQDGYYFGADGKLEEGMVEVEGDTYYVKDKELTYDYQIVKDYIYYFGEDGKMVTDREQDGYYFGVDGKLEAVNVFITIESNTYYVVNNVIVYNYQVIEGNVYYFGEDGKMVTDRNHEGYYFDEEGKMEATNVFITVESNTYYVVNNFIVYNYQIIEDGLYNFGSDGKLKKNCDLEDGFKADDNGRVYSEEKAEIALGDRMYCLEGTVLSVAYSLGLDFEITVNGESYFVSGMGECKDPNVIVPEAYENKPVTGVKEKAFEGCELLITIKLPDTIVEIGDKAFSGCTALIKITMPEKVEIGQDVFRGSINVEVSIQHMLEFVEAKEASCASAGNIEHYACTHCGKLYADADGTEQIYDVVITVEHDFVNNACSVCGKIRDAVLIVSVDEIPYLGKFPLGTLEDAIGLPATVNVKTADGKTHELAVQWELSDYDKSQAGSYVIRGHVQAGELQFKEGVSSEVEALIDVVETMKGTADIVFIIDTSGSMSEELANVKNNIIKIAQALEDKGVSARWGLVDYSDYTQSTSYNEATRIAMNGTSPWFISADEYKTAISKVTLRNGGDSPEVAVDGLMAAMTLETRKDARTFYVLVTDCSYKNNNNYGVSGMSEAIEKLQDNDVCVSVVTNSSYSSSYSSLVASTDGILTTNIGGNFMDVLYTQLTEKIYEDVIA